MNNKAAYFIAAIILFLLWRHRSVSAALTIGGAGNLNANIGDGIWQGGPVSAGNMYAT